MNEGEYNVTGRVTRITALRLTLWIGLAAWFLANALAHPYSTGEASDWAYFTAHHEGAYKTYAEYGQFPQWDPYSCGGIPAVGNVQNNAASPIFLLTLIFGLGPGLKIGWLVLFILGLEGTYQYARFKGAVGLGAVLAAAAYCFCTRFATPFWDGQPAFLGFLLVPWVLLGFEKGIEDYRWTAVGGFFAAWVFCEGGAVATPMLVVVLTFVLLYHLAARVVRSETRRSWYRALVAFALLGLIGAGLSAMRVLPVLDTLIHFPREWQPIEGNTVQHVLRMVFDRSSEGGYAGPGTAYVGVGLLGLLAWAVFSRDRRGVLLLGFVALTVVLAMGTSGPFGLYEAVRKLPFLRNLRCPFRYTYFTALFVAVGGGRGLALLEHQLLGLGERAKRWRLFERMRGARTAFTILVVAGTLALTGWIAYRAFRDGPRWTRNRIQNVFGRSAPLRVERPFAQSFGNRWSADVWPAANLGGLTCFEEQPFPESAALRGDLPQEEYLTDAQAGTVRRTYWSPQRIELDVDLTKPARLVVNQNAHRGWWVLPPGRIVDLGGLLAVDLPAGRRQVVIGFDDPLIGAGFAIALLTAILVATWLVTGYLRRRRRPPPGTGGDGAAKPRSDAAAETPAAETTLAPPTAAA